MGMPMPRQKSMMVFRRSPAAVIIEPLEILYSWRIMQLLEIGIAVLKPMMSLVAVFRDTVSHAAA